MILYVFVRAETFYNVPYADDDWARVGALFNPGTRVVVNLVTKAVVWNSGDPDNKKVIAALTNPQT